MKLTEQDVINYCESHPDSELHQIYKNIGAKAACSLVSLYSGCLIYIPLIGTVRFNKNKRDTQIREAFSKGMSKDTLAREYGLSCRTIHKIIHGK